MDVKGNFWNRVLQEEVYVAQPKNLNIHTILTIYTSLIEICMD